MTRDEAINLLMERDIALLTLEERETLLLDWWSIDEDDPEYETLPYPLKVEIARTDGPSDPGMMIFDPLVQIAIRHSYLGVVNSYLEKQLAYLKMKDAVEGKVEKLDSCPCCGYRSLQESDGYEICPVCFWEDDGTTEIGSYSEPNHMTLGAAQLNFRRIGAVSEECRNHVLTDGKERYVPTIF